MDFLFYTKNFRNQVKRFQLFRYKYQIKISSNYRSVAVPRKSDTRDRGAQAES